MKTWPVLAVVVGIAAIAGLVAYFGAGAVIRSLFAVGYLGFAAICAIHLALMAVMGLAWRTLLPGAPAWVAIWGRLVRDSGSEVLPLSQVGGYVLGARALALAGISGTVAAATTIVDVTFEFVAQLAYTALGLGLLAWLRPDSVVATPAIIGLAAAVAAAVAFLLLQRHGFGHFDRVARILGRGWAKRSAAGAAALHAALRAIYRRPGGLWLCFALHLVCWVASAAEVWLALRLAGQALSFTTVLVLESMLYAARTAAFVVPNAVGVQEGAYILLGAAFGLTPEMALALSLLKRARDIAIGLPMIGIWQAVEGGRLWRRRNAGPATHASMASPD
ncbi:MAG: flippase-like domain-containing protein [Alphaproteobacteria bacterium]|nr:flippase-like domain-containing protein [Alphaproteobacteria bacterium]